jgi:hypothetical protein
MVYAIDVPPTTDQDKVYEILAKGERSGVWRFQTGYDARVTPSSAGQS